ncbi:MAG: serine acetyltransferase [Verrucomicrobia bacterium]|nr:serine acetyltransferase [Verrucomicrobiota bacterium]
MFGIFISSQAVIGRNCTLFQQVTIGSNTLRGTRRPGSPVVGDNVLVGAGAKVIGHVRVGDNSRIGANAVVYDDVPPHSVVVLERYAGDPEGQSRQPTLCATRGGAGLASKTANGSSRPTNRQAIS